MWPSLAGSVNLYPAAYNPLTGYVYLPAIEMGMKYAFEEIKVVSNVRHFGAAFEFKFAYELNLAMDVKSGTEVWRDQKGKSGYAGGMLTTSGNLVFYTSETGQFQAVNASTGDILYSFGLGARPKSRPDYLRPQRQTVRCAIDRRWRHRRLLGKPPGTRRPYRGLHGVEAACSAHASSGARGA